MGFAYVEFAAIRVGDVVSFLTTDNGFCGSGRLINRTGVVIKKTAKTVVVWVTRDTRARILSSSWYQRSVRRIGRVEDILSAPKTTDQLRQVLS